MPLLNILAEAAHEPAPMFLPIWAFPLIATLFFVIIGVLTFTYRDVAHRHAEKGAGHDAAHDDHGGHH